VGASEIGLPTRGAVIVSSSRTFQHKIGFCKVLGRIAPVDPHADPIRFELNLPDNWNGKAVQFGGGAFNGYLHESDGLGSTVVGEKNKPGPLARGYATFGSDSGHHRHYLFLPDALNALNAKFALNDEQRKNFASDSLKKTHDVAVALMRVRYSSAPRRTYFIGGSTGGREAMMVVDRWPEDYDGVMAAYAAWNQIESDLQFIRVSQALYSKSGWLPAAKTNCSAMPCSGLVMLKMDSMMASSAIRLLANSTRTVCDVQMARTIADAFLTPRNIQCQSLPPSLLQISK
jgi:hypothetical protein